MKGRLSVPSNAREHRLISILCAGWILGLVSVGAAAAHYIDTFDVKPWVPSGAVGSFTTAGLSYSGDYDGLFAWEGTGGIDCDAVDADPSGVASFTITSRDGKAFVFNSILWDNDAGAVTVIGSGSEPFTINIAAYSGAATHSPPGGPKLVSQLEFSSSNFWALMDDVSVELVPPWMDVQGNGTTIVNGDLTPSSGDDTDLGTTPIGTPVSSTFTLRSIGEAGLDLTGSPYVTCSSNPSGDFSVFAQPTTDPIPSGGSDTFTVQCNPTASGLRTATISIANDSAASPYEFWVQCTGAADSTPPTVTSIVRQTPSDEYTNADTVTFRVTFDEDVQNVSAGDSDFALSGAAAGTVNSALTITADTVYDVEITGVAGDGELNLDIKSGNDIQDAAGNPLGDTPTIGTEQTYTIDNTPPTVPDDLSPADNSYVTVTSPTLTWGASSDPGGSGLRETNTYRVIVTEVPPGTTGRDYYTPTANPEYTPTLADGVFKWKVYSRDKAGNHSEYSDEHTLTIDGTQPHLTSFAREVPPDQHTSADSLVFRATFDEDVLNVDAGDFAVNSASTAAVTGADPVNASLYDVTVSGGNLASFNGVVNLNLAGGQDITDLAGNALPVGEPGTDETYTVDNDPPGITSFALSSPPSSPTNADQLVFRATFDEDVQNVDVADFEANSSSTASVTAVNPEGAGPTYDTYDVTISGGDLAGFNDTVNLDLAAGQDITDLVGNPLPGGEPATDETVTLDNDPPTISIGAPSATDTNTGPVTYTVTYGGADSVTLADGDVTLNKTGTANGTVAVSGSGTTSTVTLSAITGDGMLGISIAAATAIDDVGNAAPAAGPSTTFNVDNTPPTISIGAPSSTDTNAGPVTYTVTYGGADAATLGAGDVTLNKTGTADGTVAVSGSETATRTVTISTITGDGSLGISIAAGTAIDDVGNTAPAVGPSTTFNVDNTPPTVTGVTENLGVIADANAGDQTFTVTIDFNETMNQGVAPTASFLTALEDPSATITLNLASGWTSSTTYVARFDVADVGGGEEIDDIDVRVTGARDVVGNTQAQYDESDVFSIDTLNPTITSITSTTPAGYYNVGANINVTVSFSEDVVCSGDFLQVPLDTGDVIQRGAFALTSTTAGTYAVGVGDNSCDLDSGTPSIVGVATLKDAVGNDANLAPAPPESIADGSDIVVDTTDPAIGAIGVAGDDNELDGNCGKTVSYSVTITDNCCIDLDASPITVTPSATDAAVSGLTTTMTPAAGKVTSVLVTGTFVVSASDACSTVPSVQIDAEDCAGNTSSRTDSGPTIADAMDPTFSDFTVTPDDDLVDGDCLEAVNFSVDVHDNCRIDLDDPTAIIVSESAANASTSGLTWNADKAGLQSDFTIIGSFTVEDLTGCPVIPTIEVQVTDLCGNVGSASKDGAEIHDDTVPVVNDLMFHSDATYTVRETHFTVDDGCEATLYFSANVADNCCVRPDRISVGFDVATGNGEMINAGASVVQNGVNRVDVTGFFIVGSLTSCPARAEVQIDAVDSCGNPAVSQTTTAGEGIVTDEIAPVIGGLTVSDETVDENCEATVTFSATVTDNCCVTPGGVTVTVTLPTGNATLGTPTIDKTQNGQGQVDVTGSVLVSDLTGCPATVQVAVDANDCCSNSATQAQETGDVTDTTVPVISGLMFNIDETYTVQETNFTVDDCCEVTVYFSANVTDNCCVAWASVDVTVTLPTANAILENIVVNRVQNGRNRVDVTGSAVVRCLTSCPARVEVHIGAADCFGNPATSATSLETEGRVYDEIAPIPRDDPQQDVVMDESAALDPMVEVRVDKDGTYRLLVREGTPVNLNVVANDSDNGSCGSHDPCDSCSGCDAALRIHDILDAPIYGAVVIVDAERTSRGDSTSIRYAPAEGFAGSDQFTYRIVDACGNVSSEATVYVEVVARGGMEDLLLMTCSDASVEFDVTVTDPWIDPDNPDEIPFLFSVVTPPIHGVVSGDLTRIVYTSSGATTADVASATIVLTYTPAVGFVGRDRMTVQCVDPFGGTSTAVIDIAIEDCTAEEEPPPINAEQGSVLSMILPLSFQSILEGRRGSVLLVSLEDGLAYPLVLSATWNENSGQYVLLVDTTGLGLGEYRLTIPLGGGETVELTIEVEAAGEAG